MTTVTAKRLGIVAICLPYLVTTVLFMIKMADVCGTHSLFLTGAVWLFSSACMILPIKWVFSKIQLVEGDERIRCVVTLFVCWIVFGFIEVITETKLLGDECGVLSAVSLLGWPVGTVFMSILSDNIPNIFMD